MIIDAGGGTVDLSTYSFTGTSPISVEEIATPDCSSEIQPSAVAYILMLPLRYFTGFHKSQR